MIILLTRVQTILSILSPTASRTRNAPKPPNHDKNTGLTPSVPLRTTKRLTTSPDTTSQLTRRSNALACLSTESNAYLTYKENNTPTTRLERVNLKPWNEN